MMFVIILGGIYGGVFMLIEVSVVVVFYVFVVGIVVYCEIGVKDFYGIFYVFVVGIVVCCGIS